MDHDRSPFSTATMLRAAARESIERATAKTEIPPGFEVHGGRLCRMPAIDCCYQVHREKVFQPNDRRENDRLTLDDDRIHKTEGNRLMSTAPSITSLARAGALMTVIAMVASPSFAALGICQIFTR
jgi:hypothetical protein